MPFKLARSTLYAMWRDKAVDDHLVPKSVEPGEIDETLGRSLVACAKKRWDVTIGSGTGTDYTRLRLDGVDLKGFCFVVADEVEQYLTRNGHRAKAVRVEPIGGGGDHYFTVVNKGNAGNSLIVDTTWKQFMSYPSSPPTA
jgi:hypothetical protein